LTKLHFEFPHASEDGKVYPDIDKFFDVVAWERAQETMWDPTQNCAVAINMDNLQGTLDAMKGDDIFETFYELEDDKIVVNTKVDDGIDKEKLMLDTNRKSIATWTRSSRRLEGGTNRGTPTSGTRVSLGDLVASLITVGTTAAGSALTMADVQSMVTSTVLPMIAREVAKEFSGMQGLLSSVVTQMQDNMTLFQQRQQQQLQQFQQQQIQFQQQQQQWFHQQLEAQQPIQNDHKIHNIEVTTPPTTTTTTATPTATTTATATYTTTALPASQSSSTDSATTATTSSVSGCSSNGG
jgi:hypothetical protein